MRPELTGCIQLPTGAVKLDLTPATQALIWRCHFSPLAFVFLSRPPAALPPFFRHSLSLSPFRSSFLKFTTSVSFFFFPLVK